MVFTGVSGSGKSSLAFGTLYAEAQRRYLESVSPYARRLFHQMPIPEVDEIEGLPPAVALQQQRGTVTTRSSVESVTTLSNLLRMLYSRAGDYPKGQPLLYAESFSPNTPEGACPQCHGLGSVYEVTEQSMVQDDNLTIRKRGNSCMAYCLARTKPARNINYIGLWCRCSLERSFQKRPRLDLSQTNNHWCLCIRVSIAKKYSMPLKQKWNLVIWALSPVPGGMYCTPSHIRKVP